jgi:hypothetical protein
MSETTRGLLKIVIRVLGFAKGLLEQFMKENDGKVQET